MASNNSLLGSGKSYTPDKEPAPKGDFFVPRWMYHRDIPEGVLVRLEREFNKLSDDWVDHPGKCTLLPGHEKIYQEVEPGTVDPDEKTEDMDAQETFAFSTETKSIFETTPVK